MGTVKSIVGIGMWLIVLTCAGYLLSQYTRSIRTAQILRSEIEEYPRKVSLDLKGIEEINYYVRTGIITVSAALLAIYLLVLMSMYVYCTVNKKSVPEHVRKQCEWGFAALLGFVSGFMTASK